MNELDEAGLRLPTPVVIPRHGDIKPVGAIASRKLLGIPTVIDDHLSCDPDPAWVSPGGIFKFSLDQLVDSELTKVRAKRAAIREERDRQRAANDRSHQERQLRKKAMKAAKSEPEPSEPETTNQTKALPEPTPDEPVPASLYASMVGMAPREPVSPPRLQGVINDVFDILVESGEPMSVSKISMLLPRFPRQAVRSSAANLFKQGVVEKVKPGVYKVKEEYRVQDVRVDVVARTESERSHSNIEHIFPAPNGESLPVAADLSQNLETIVARHATIDEINDVLDLLFPNGFRAKHLPLIDAWRKATLELMDSLNRP